METEMPPSHRRALKMISRYGRESKQLQSYYYLRRLVHRLDRNKARVIATLKCAKRPDIKLVKRLALYHTVTTL